METLILDVPSYLGFENRYMVHEKVFEFIKLRSTDYLKSYEILYNYHSDGRYYVEKLIRDWDLKCSVFKSTKENPTNKDKVNVIEDIVREGKNGDALIFFDYNQREKDIGNEILLDQCVNEFGIYLRVCRLDFEGDLI